MHSNWANEKKKNRGFFIVVGKDFENVQASWWKTFEETTLRKRFIDAKRHKLRSLLSRFFFDFSVKPKFNLL